MSVKRIGVLALAFGVLSTIAPLGPAATTDTAEAHICPKPGPGDHVSIDVEDLLERLQTRTPDVQVTEGHEEWLDCELNRCYVDQPDLSNPKDPQWGGIVCLM